MELTGMALALLGAVLAAGMAGIGSAKGVGLRRRQALSLRIPTNSVRHCSCRFSPALRVCTACSSHSLFCSKWAS